MHQSFIATPAPLSNSVENFWQMIIEKNVKTVVELTCLEKEDRKTTANYLPDKHNLVVYFNDVRLELTESSIHKYHKKRYLTLF